MKVKVINRSNHQLPQYATQGSAGLDIRANNVFDIELWPGERAMVPTGLFLEIPEGFEGRVQPRSGLAIKHGITVINTPGCIDSDFRDEVMVLLINHDPHQIFTIRSGERIGQLIFSKVEQCEWDEVKELSTTERTGGFGHTGVK